MTVTPKHFPNYLPAITDADDYGYAFDNDDERMAEAYCEHVAKELGVPRPSHKTKAPPDEA